MRKTATLLAVLGILAGLTVAGGGATAGDQVPFLAGDCTADTARGYEPPAGCQRYRFLHGPLTITPGDNLILFGPITIEKPPGNGYMLRFRPDLIRVTTQQAPPIEELHLHHAVWFSFGRSGHQDPLAAVGEEKTTLQLPNNSDGYSGVSVRSDDMWLLNYMIHNQLQLTDEVFIVYEIDFLPTPEVTKLKQSGKTFTPLTPVWLNVAGFNGLNPVYNVERDRGGIVKKDGEDVKVCGFPSQQCADHDPYGVTEHAGNGAPPEEFGWIRGPVQAATSDDNLRESTVFWMGGHVHPGGTWIDVHLWRDLDGDKNMAPDGSEFRRVFTSDAEYFDVNGPVSWDMAMEVTKPGYRLAIKEGDKFVVNAYYETEKASWYEGMGIVVMYAATEAAPGVDPFDSSGPGIDPDDVQITHGMLDEAKNHCGGTDRGLCPQDAREEPLDIQRRVRTNLVSIQGFDYVPGGLGTANIAVPEVVAGDTLTFVNADAPAVIFHTVTACKYPCSGATGVSYPLANGESDGGSEVEFDSLQLGYGPDSPFGGFRARATAAANRADYSLPTKGMDPGIYTYFCRVHPNMRGAFAVAAS